MAKIIKFNSHILYAGEENSEVPNGKEWQKSKDESKPLAIDKQSIIGNWCWKNDKQPLLSSSYYTLSFTNDDKVTLSLITYYFNSYNSDSRFLYFYKSEESVEGSYSLSNDNVVFNWNRLSRKKSSLLPQYECKSPANNILQSTDDKVSEYFDQLLSKLSKVKISNMSDNYLILMNSYTLCRKNDEDENLLTKNRSTSNILYFNTNGDVSTFKHIYNDGIVKIESGTMTIEYANGNKYIGTGYIGMIKSDGTIGQSPIKAMKYMNLLSAAMNVPDISDLETFFEDGTLTDENGRTLTFKSGLTDKQNSQIEKNIASFVSTLNALVQKELLVLRQKSAATKAQLLKEGFSAYYVNSIFDNYRILEGTPQALIDRALQLGCHMHKHPVSLSDVHLDLQKSGKTYAIVITNLKTGEDAFVGFVKFHWASHKAIYVGYQAR